MRKCCVLISCEHNNKKYHFMVIQCMTNCCCKGKEVRSRSDPDREVKLSWAHTVTLKHTDINFRVTESVANGWLASQLKQILHFS